MLKNTLEKFGYPNSVIKEYENWILLLRPRQVTLASLVLICKDDVNKFSEISKESMDEFHNIIKDVEKNLSILFNFDKINYLMLMMKDPDVHFHIIPRYADEKQWNDIIFKDAGWPETPELTKINEINNKSFNELVKYIKSKFI